MRYSPFFFPTRTKLPFLSLRACQAGTRLPVCHSLVRLLQEERSVLSWRFSVGLVRDVCCEDGDPISLCGRLNERLAKWLHQSATDTRQRNTGPVAGHNRIGARELTSMPRRQGRARARTDTVCDGCSAAHRISNSTMDARFRPGNTSALGCHIGCSRSRDPSCRHLPHPHPENTFTAQCFSVRGLGSGSLRIQSFNHNNITTAAHPLADR